ncbi:hypothetical protein TsFJ059_003940 [Trichoderma semiorbis]|uniref:Uncharacterized protein n=1 Tax=Trichoderma semiorbis TaxID=1491008 RepID=A0A9P8KWH9_9HYPO|nr:hypothetical protein TsFJ059_003940 [Trichoderma semiorbis]
MSDDVTALRTPNGLSQRRPHLTRNKPEQKQKQAIDNATTPLLRIPPAKSISPSNAASVLPPTCSASHPFPHQLPASAKARQDTHRQNTPPRPHPTGSSQDDLKDRFNV